MSATTDTIGLKLLDRDLVVRLDAALADRAIGIDGHGLLPSHGGRDFAIVLKALDELGYRIAWRVLNSKDFGVPQQRRRVYIVAMHRDWRDPAEVLKRWRAAPTALRTDLS